MKKVINETVKFSAHVSHWKGRNQKFSLCLLSKVNPDCRPRHFFLAGWKNLSVVYNVISLLVFWRHGYTPLFLKNLKFSGLLQTWKRLLPSTYDTNFVWQSFALQLFSFYSGNFFSFRVDPCHSPFRSNGKI